MICPNCKNESDGAKWCPYCGIQLETEERMPDSALSEPNDENAFEEEYNLGRQTDNKALKITLAILCPIAAIVLVMVILVACGIVNFGSSKEPVVTEESEVLEKSNTESLKQTAVNQLKIGDYEEAEAVLKAILEIEPDNEEITTLCKIVYNYNRAIKKVETRKFGEAKNLFEKIPDDYLNYDISFDIEKLGEELAQADKAHAIFETVKEHMRNGEYADASDTVMLIDEQYLEDEDAALLEQYNQQIREYNESEEQRMLQMGNSLDSTRALEIVNSYCNNFASAVNNSDFSIVESQLGGYLLEQQRALFQNHVNGRISINHEGCELVSFSKLSDTCWEVEVKEGTTVHYPDGTVDSGEVYNIYTIEYINSAFYLTMLV